MVTVSDCTSSSSRIHLQETYSSRLVAYNYTITLSSPNQWIFDFNYYIQCPNDSFVSIRGPNRVCISVRAFQPPDYCRNLAYGALLCEEDDGVGLTGPYSFAEADVIGGYMNSKIIEEPASTTYTYTNFWTDGFQESSDTIYVTDDTLNGTTGYQWETAPGEQSVQSFNCTFIYFQGSTPTIFINELCYEDESCLVVAETDNGCLLYGYFTSLLIYDKSTGRYRIGLKVRAFEKPNFCQNQTAAVELCEQDGAIGLTGPYSYSEANVIGGYMKSRIKEEPADKGYSYINFWTDGKRATSSTFNVTDETLNGTTGYRWETAPKNSVQSYNCTFIYFLGSTPTIYIKECDVTWLYDWYCLRGAVCRTQPISDL
uniref:C-type lectin domain-containing protein n=1 Tax=Caenorhabditis tropicalis TaxID=1561998 RepID=A0A1I7TTM0_9PELO